MSCLYAVTYEYKTLNHYGDGLSTFELSRPASKGEHVDEIVKRLRTKLVSTLHVETDGLKIKILSISRL